jgi:hypothetical protein
LLPYRDADHCLVGLPRLRFLLLVGAGIVFAISVPAVVAVLRAAGPARAAAVQARQAMAAVDQADPEAAQHHFQRASSLFTTASGRLDQPLASLGLAVPVVRQNLTASRELSAAGGRLAAVGSRLADEVDADRLRVVDGTVPIDRLAAMAPALDRSADDLERATAALTDLGSPVLLPPVGSAIDDGTEYVEDASERVALLHQVSQLLPAILGQDGPRRYFLAVQNNSESRPTGGFIGSFGELIAEGGRLRLERFDRIAELNTGGDPDRALDASAYEQRYGRFQPDRTWQNVNLSPDFPTAAAVIADLYPKSGGQRIDGVIAVDPPALAALLRLTGPVEVRGWPTPLTEENVVPVLLHDSYLALPNPDRVEFVGDAAEAVWDRLLSIPLGTSEEILDVVTPAVRGGHLQAWLASPEEQSLVRRAGLDGALTAPRSDALLATTSNAGANKIDWFLRRRLRYDLTVSPRNGRASVAGHLEIDLENGAPSSGLPPYVIGPAPSLPGAEPGDNRSYLSVYSSLGFQDATIDGQRAVLESGEELGRSVYATFLTVPAQSTRTLAMDLAGEVRLTDDGWYELDLGRQPLLHPDEVTVTLRAPRGYRIDDVDGLERQGRTATGEVVVRQNEVVRARIVPDDGGD